MKPASNLYALYIEPDKTYYVDFTHGDAVFADPEVRERGGGPKPLSARERVRHFWSKVKIGAPDACWDWQASTTKNGYGQFVAGRRRGKLDLRAAHRTAYELTRGPISNGLHVLHQCDRPRCCNPAHLMLGTQHDNIVDATRKGRMRGSRVRRIVTPEMLAQCLSGPRGTVSRVCREQGIAFGTLLAAVLRARRRAA